LGAGCSGVGGAAPTDVSATSGTPAPRIGSPGVVGTGVVGTGAVVDG